VQSDKKAPNVGAIIEGVVGELALIIVAVLISMMWKRKQRITKTVTPRMTSIQDSARDRM